MSPNYIDRINDLNGFPRVSGDEPRGRADSGLSPAFSPRERG